MILKSATAEYDLIKMLKVGVVYIGSVLFPYFFFLMVKIDEIFLFLFQASFSPPFFCCICCCCFAIFTTQSVSQGGRSTLLITQTLFLVFVVLAVY